MRIFKNKSFARFAKKSEISDSALCRAVKDAEQGLIDADLGGGVIKQRVARTGQGKSGGYRTMILFKMEMRAFFVHGFAKNEKDNIEPEDLIAFRKLAARMLTCNDLELTQAINKNILTEVICHDEKLP